MVDIFARREDAGKSRANFLPDAFSIFSQPFGVV
jgi:hypothetical protein